MSSDPEKAEPPDTDRHPDRHTTPIHQDSSEGETDSVTSRDIEKTTAAATTNGERILRGVTTNNSIPISPDVFPPSESDSSTSSRHGMRNDGGEEGEEAQRPAPRSGAYDGNDDEDDDETRRPISIVPREERRGFLAQLAIIPEVTRPVDYCNRTKWTITAIIGLAACAAPMGSSIFYPASPDIARDFSVPLGTVNFTIGFYMLAMAIFPLWWSASSEVLGRRTIYLVSFGIGAAASFATGWSVNIGMLVVFRILAGGAAASVQAVGAGTISDIWEVRERGKAMGIFYLGPLLGPIISPLFSGALTNSFGWKSTMWFMTGFCGLNFFSVLFGLPETLSRKKQQQRQTMSTTTNPQAADAATTTTTTNTATADTAEGSGLTRATSNATSAIQSQTKSIKKFLLDPLKILAYLRFPAVLCTVYYSAITFGTLFCMNIAMQTGYSQPPYGYSSLIVGLLFLPPGLGYFGASMLGGRWLDRIMHRAAVKAGRYDERGRIVYLPEDRMRENAWISATLYPVSLLWFGWSLQYGVHWICPAIATFCFGIGSMLVFSAGTTMLTEFMPGKSSSGVALNNFVRNVFACVGAIVSEPLIKEVTFRWLFTFLALWCWVTGNLCIWVLRRNSREWRKQMDKALKKGG